MLAVLGCHLSCKVLEFYRSTFQACKVIKAVHVIDLVETVVEFVEDVKNLLHT